MKIKASFFNLFFLLLLIMLSLNLTFQHESQFQDYKEHPCIRPCNNQTFQMTCQYNWTIEWYAVLSKACLDCPFNKTNCLRKQCVSGDGFPRPILTVNRMIPGPSIIACQGDIIDIVVFNSLHLAEGTSIHWHGLNQRHTPYMDGVGMVTQCPIISHSFFEYRFYANETGTHLYHAHSGLQRADGLFGPIIVHEYDRNNFHLNNYDYDLPEHVITVNDWINETSISKFAGHHHSDGNNKPTSLLINGKGVYSKYYDKNQTLFETPRAEFWVNQNKRYRFRLINAGILYCPIQFFIDGHNLTIIASDGKQLEPYTVESLIIYAGERYDFILNANNTPKSYWIKTKGWADCRNFKAYQTAILRYNESLNQDLLPDNNTVTYDTLNRTGLQFNPWNQQINDTNRKDFIYINELKSILDNSSIEFYKKIFDPNKKVKKHYLAMEFNKVNNPEFLDEKLYSLNMLAQINRAPLYTPQINNISMQMPSMPVLYEWDSVPKNQICNHLNRDHICPNRTEYCSCIYLMEFDIGDIVEFVIVDEGFTFQSNHPMHLHGASFAILAMDKLNQSVKVDQVIKMDENGKINRNFDRPPIKDTVTVSVGGYTIIRFIADNPGTWMFHCHLDFHSEVGMGLLIKIGNKTDLPPEPINWPKCGNYFYKNLEPIALSLNKSVMLRINIIYVFVSCLILKLIFIDNLIF